MSAVEPGGRFIVTQKKAGRGCNKHCDRIVHKIACLAVALKPWHTSGDIQSILCQRIYPIGRDSLGNTFPSTQQQQLLGDSRGAHLSQAKEVGIH